MSVQKSNCEVCGKDIEVYICCSQYDCGCRGLPTEPPVCSEECYDKYMTPKKQENGENDDTLPF